MTSLVYARWLRIEDDLSSGAYTDLISMRQRLHDCWITLQELAVKNGYTPPITDITKTTEMKKCEDDAKAVNALLGSLVNNEFARVVGCTTSKEIWDKLKNVHEGDNKIREAKLQHHRNLFEGLKMTQAETVEQFMSKVNEIINSIRGLGEELKDAIVVKKILRSLPKLYNLKVSAIEESKNLNTLNMDELHRTLTAYEMRMVKSKPTEKEAAFKTMKKLKIKEDIEDEDSNDELIAYLARKLKRGGGKYKGKLPLKCFDCGGIGNFASKCPKKGKVIDSDDEDTQESSVQHKATYESKEEEEHEAEYDLQAELYSALTNLKSAKKKIKTLQSQLVEKEEQVSQLNITVEEMTKITDELSINLSSNVEECTVLEEKLKILKIELEEIQKMNLQEEITSSPPVNILKSKGKEVLSQPTGVDISSSRKSNENVLDEILSLQRPLNLKIGLGYVKEGSSGAVKTKGTGTAGNPVRFVKEKQRGSHVKKVAKRTVDKDGFTSVNYQKARGSWFGNNDGAKIEGRGTVKLDTRNVKTNNILYVSGLKHNLLSVSQICDSGNQVLFTKEGCVIKKIKNGKTVARGRRTADNLYTLSEAHEDRCMLGHEDENLLWYRRLGHISFKNLAKLSKKKVVRDLPKIKSPTYHVCAPCQKGKQTRATYK
ncbi:uncharacterized protein LOC122645033 [Telopea speciosissima]|uniref:uncharacterized protein LOC122645033 n=1 Tax=Telopea speciosissima TaxID=54955 RepID=UPI001CC523E3|nr:uncharacterized protein LOC122645033 [Telopea speciosissima]